MDSSNTVNMLFLTSNTRDGLVLEDIDLKRFFLSFQHCASELSSAHNLQRHEGDSAHSWELRRTPAILLRVSTLRLCRS